jgi:hypothetical protein
METSKGTSTYLYLKLAKVPLLSFMFFLQQNWRTGGQNRFCLCGRGVDVVGRRQGSG